jgi:hypothetical protein
MSHRTTQVVLLCEDTQHEVFARRFLELNGVSGRAIRVEKAPKGRGSGEQWVREVYPKEVGAHRSENYIKGRALIVMIDEDTQATGSRAEALVSALEHHEQGERTPDEAIIHAIPARNIETWIAYLDGEDVDETREKPYAKLSRQKDCRPHVKKLKEMCDRGRLREPAPKSLERTCTDFRRRWR